MGLSAIIRRTWTRYRFRQTSEQNIAPFRLPFRATPQPKHVPGLRSNPSRYCFEHHSPVWPYRVKRIGPRICAHLSQASVTYAPCFASSSRVCASVRRTDHLPRQAEAGTTRRSQGRSGLGGRTEAPKLFLDQFVESWTIYGPKPRFWRRNVGSLRV